MSTRVPEFHCRSAVLETEGLELDWLPLRHRRYLLQRPQCRQPPYVDHQLARDLSPDLRVTLLPVMKTTGTTSLSCSHGARLRSFARVFPACMGIHASKTWTCHSFHARRSTHLCTSGACNSGLAQHPERIGTLCGTPLTRTPIVSGRGQLGNSDVVGILHKSHWTVVVIIRLARTLPSLFFIGSSLFFIGSRFFTQRFLGCGHSCTSVQRERHFLECASVPTVILTSKTTPTNPLPNPLSRPPAPPNFVLGLPPLAAPLCQLEEIFFFVTPFPTMMVISLERLRFVAISFASDISFSFERMARSVKPPCHRRLSCQPQTSTSIFQERPIGASSSRCHGRHCWRFWN